MIASGEDASARNFRSLKEEIESFPINSLQALNIVVSFIHITQLQLSMDEICLNFLHYLNSQSQVIFFYHLASFNFLIIFASKYSQSNLSLECTKCGRIDVYIYNSKDVVLKPGMHAGDHIYSVDVSQNVCESTKNGKMHDPSLSFSADPLVAQFS